MVQWRLLLWLVRAWLVRCHSCFICTCWVTTGNMGSFGFPLFSHIMFKKLTYKWANAIFGGIALILIPVPFVSFSIRRYFVSNPPRKALFLYGPSLRKRSTMCSQLMQAEEKPTIESRDGEPWPPFRSISNCLNFLHPSWTRYSSLVTDALVDLCMSFRIIVYITFLTLVSISNTNSLSFLPF